MGYCIGIAIVAQLISFSPKFEFRLAPQVVDVQVTKECDSLKVSRSSKLVDKTIKQQWHNRPNITICPSSRLSLYRLKRATAFWESLGYEFGVLQKVERNDYNCATGEPRYNEILIDIPGQDFQFGDHLGTTRTWWRTDTGEILKSKIEIVNGWENSERIIEHELGHALGFKDNNITGHMMNRSWTAGGYNKRDLNKQ